MHALCDPKATDFALFLLLTAGLPIYSWATFPATRRRLAGSPGDRRAVYRETLLWLWGIGALVVGATLSAGRSQTSLGLGPETSRAAAAALAAALAVAAYLAYQVSLVARHDKYREQIREQMGDLGVGELVPVTAPELRTFAMIAVSAGICEEVAYRGFVMPFLAHFIGGWAALVVASALFGAGHAYQGLNGAVKTGFSGLLLGGLFLATGTLLPSIVLHAAVDLQGGALGYLARRRDGKN